MKIKGKWIRTRQKNWIDINIEVSNGDQQPFTIDGNIDWKEMVGNLGD